MVVQELTESGAATIGEEMFKYMLDLTNNCAIIIHKNLELLYLNRAMMQYIGKQSDGVQSGSMRVRLGHLPDFLRVCTLYVDQVLSTKASSISEEEIFLRGEVFHLQIKAIPIEDEKGDVFAVGLICLDITSAVLAREVLQRQRNLAISLSSTNTFDEALPLILSTGVLFNTIDSGGI